ncbi:MAG: hypothetical protein P9F19_12980 [Candidatus Contendobacter sp.]|nr:hypothetical protein [Candidatus Contendobacter sp.]MDG4558285.1 hypothetical protein [Candidatus Contendobacter sp.]
MQLHFNPPTEALLKPLMDFTEQIDRETDQPILFVTVGKWQGIRAGSSIENASFSNSFNDMLSPCRFRRGENQQRRRDYA